VRFLLQKKKPHSSITKTSDGPFHGKLLVPVNYSLVLFRRYTVLDAILPWKKIELNNQIVLKEIVSHAATWH
jgi:hypothetical protein